MATVVQASFTAANGTALGSYAPEVGGGFALHPSYSIQITITNNQAVRDSTPSLMFATAVPDSADQTVEFLAVKEYGGTSFYHGGCARTAPTANTFYCWRHDESSGFRLFKVIAGTWTQLGSLYSDSLASGESRACKLSVVGSTLNGYVGGVLRVGPITDTAISEVGRIGIVMSGTGGRLDDLLGQTVGGGGTSVSSDLALKWDMLNVIASDLALKWDIFATTASDLTLLWDIRDNELTSVSSDLALVWDTFAPVSSDLSLNWDALQQVFSDLAVKWDVYQTVSGDLTILFDVRNLVESDLALIWDAVGRVSSNLTLRWDLGDNFGRVTIIGSSFRRFIG